MASTDSYSAIRIPAPGLIIHVQGWKCGLRREKEERAGRGRQRISGQAFAEDGAAAMLVFERAARQHQVGMSSERNPRRQEPPPSPVKDTGFLQRLQD